MPYVYVLESLRVPQRHYIGITSDLRQRLIDHNQGKSTHTSRFKPWRVVVYTAFLEGETAARYERYLKSGSGHTFLHRHLLPQSSLAPESSPPMTNLPRHRI